VVHMEVPCCRGFVFAAEKAIKRTEAVLPMNRIMIGLTGEILKHEDIKRQ